MRKYFGRIILYGSTLLILIVIWIIYAEISYWIDRAPRDINAAIKSNVDQINFITNAVHRYYNFHKKLPASLDCMVNDPVGRQSWVQIITDPWGFKIGYRVNKTSTNDVVMVWSYGSDNKPGGKWAAADVVRSWSPSAIDQTNSIIVKPSLNATVVPQGKKIPCE